MVFRLVKRQDSGWRDISSSVTGYISGAVSIRRIGSTVYLEISDLVTADQVDAFHIFPGLIPAGFRYSTPNFLYVTTAARNSNYTTGPFRTHRSGDVVIYAMRGGQRASLLVTWPTDDPTPTSLPPEVGT